MDNGELEGFKTGYKDWKGSEFIVGKHVEWIDKEGFPCSSELIFKDNCMIGVETWEDGFILVRDFGEKFKVARFELE